MRCMWQALLLLSTLLCSLEGFWAPKNMWEPGQFPKDVPRLNSKQAMKVATLDQKGKPPVMRDLTHRHGGLDMDDEFEIPVNRRLAVQPDEGFDIEPDQEIANDEPEYEVRIVDRIIKQADLEPKRAQLLSGSYGYSSGYPAIGVALPVIQTKTYVPLVVPVVQQPVVQVPQPVAVVQAQSQPAEIRQEQQTTVIGLPQTAAGTQSTQQNGQGRMEIPQPVEQPQLPAVQPTVPELPAVQQPVLPLPDLTTSGQGRMAIPDVPAGNTQLTDQTQTVQQQQPQVMPTITVKHKVAPQHIHIVIPKSKQYKPHGHYKYY